MYAGVVFWHPAERRYQRVAGRGPPSMAWERAPVWHSLRNELWGDTHADKAREFHGKGRHTYDKGTPGELLCRLMFYGKAIAPGLSLASHLACTCICWFRVHLSDVGASAKMEPSVKDSGKLEGSIRSSLFLAPPKFSQLVLQGILWAGISLYVSSPSFWPFLNPESWISPTPS